MLEYTDKNGNNYRIETINSNKIMIEKNSLSHFYKVVYDPEYTYRIQKTQIKAQHSANGLYKHFADCINNDFAINAWLLNPIEKILNTVKEIKA